MRKMMWVGLRCFISVLAAAVALSGAGLVQAAVEAEVARPNLAGIIKDKDGKPLRDARVFIHTARPKEGPGLMCPSCYADCRKRATTDSEGQFKIESLDPSLLFRVLVVAKGHRPQFAGNVDPATKPIEITLQENNENLDPNQRLSGRVVDGTGKPIAGAVISLGGVSRAESTRFGSNDNVDSMAVTDDDGSFVIASDIPFDAASLNVEAPGFAKRVFPHLGTGEKTHVLTLSEGATIKGRLVKNGKPIAGATIAVSEVDRRAETFVGGFSVGTDKEGKFLFVNLPPNREYVVCAKPDLLPRGYVGKAIHMSAGDDSSVQDAGDISTMPGLKLQGQIRLTDGKPMPAGTTVYVGRQEASDATQTTVDKDGRFSFSVAPSEALTLSLQIQGYRLSSRNRSLDTLNPACLTGTLKTDKTDLILEVEPGSFRNRPAVAYVDMSHEPLAGAEPANLVSGDVHVTGSVIDSETKKPLDHFVITEGRVGSYPNTIDWISTRQTEGTNGAFDLFLNKSMGSLAISVAAEGYLSQSSGLLSTAATNIIFALKKGEGANGVVVRPDGTPMPGVKVFLTDMREGVYVSENNMKPTEHIFRGTRTTMTDDRGQFSFEARVDDYSVMVLQDEGFAHVKVEELRERPEVKLQPWSRVKGKLMVGTRPGTNETIMLGLGYLPYDYHPRSGNPLCLFLKTQTDDNGEFAFDRVPPICVQVSHSPRVHETKMGIIPTSQTTNFDAKAGETKTVLLGGKGRPVTGRLVVKGYDGEIDWRADTQSMDSIMPSTDEVPDLVELTRAKSASIRAAQTDEEKQRLSLEMQNERAAAEQKLRAFYHTEKGREYYFAHNRRYALNVSTNGTFRIEDVSGGKYKLRIELHEPGEEDSMRFFGTAMVYQERKIEVPDSPGGQTDEPYDIGTIELQARRNLKVGKIAPAFEVKTVDDNPLKLSDYAGKYVLLDFWAVWCGPCKAEMPNLKATYDAYKDDPRFVMISLSLDPNSKTPKDYAAKNNLPWIMGFLGEWSRTDLPNEYGVQGIPSIFLIGPDGKIVAKELRGENIKATVGRVLGKNQSAKSE